MLQVMFAFVKCKLLHSLCSHLDWLEKKCICLSKMCEMED